MNTQQTVIANLKAWMNESELSTQSELSKKSGVAQSHISRILRGESDPTTDMLDALAKAFGRSAEDIVKETTTPRASPEVVELERTVHQLTASGKLSAAEIKAMTEMLKARG